MGVFAHKGVRLAYREAGAGPPLVLLHGLSGSALWWRRNVPALARHFRVYTVDLVGFGSSRRQRALPIRASAELLQAWAAELGLAQPRVIGHSMGAHIALHLAAAMGPGVGALVLVAASALVRDPWWRMARRLPRAGWNGAWDFLPTLAYDALRAGPLNLLGATREIALDDPAEVLGRVACPTLLVWGARDVIVTGAMGDELRASIPQARLVTVAGAGHNVMYDRPREFNRLALDFLRDPAGFAQP